MHMVRTGDGSAKRISDFLTLDELHRLTAGASAPNSQLSSMDSEGQPTISTSGVPNLPRLGAPNTGRWDRWFSGLAAERWRVGLRDVDAQLED